VDYLKMDCEGAEWDILLNTPAQVLSRIRHIELEFHNIADTTDPKMLQAHLGRAGFTSDISGADGFNGMITATLARYS